MDKRTTNAAITVILRLHMTQNPELSFGQAMDDVTAYLRRVAQLPQGPHLEGVTPEIALLSRYAAEISYELNGDIRTYDHITVANILHRAQRDTGYLSHREAARNRRSEAYRKNKNNRK